MNVFLALIVALKWLKSYTLRAFSGCAGSPTYDVKKKSEILVNAVTSSSNKPLSDFFYIGLVITVLSIVYSAYFIFRVSFTNHLVEGWTTVVVSIWLIGGVIVLFLEIIGMYIFKIFTETKNRPYAIVKDVYKKT